MAPSPFAGIILKLQRACDQLQSLDREIDLFLKGDTYEPAIKIDFKGRNQFGHFVTEFSIRMVVNKPCDPMWGIIIGEIVHNFRSALDHSIYIIASGKGRTQFPIFNCPSKYKRYGLPMLEGLSDEVTGFIKRFQPFDTGENSNSPLWHLAKLSNFDKHRTLHLTGGTMEKFEFMEWTLFLRQPVNP
jgi:hypothetical protein